jgi:hypothetical protein
MIVLEENGALGRHAATQTGRPMPVGLPYKRSPPAPTFGKQASLSSLRIMCGSRTGGWSLPCVMSD